MCWPLCSGEIKQVFMKDVLTGEWCSPSIIALRSVADRNPRYPYAACVWLLQARLVIWVSSCWWQVVCGVLFACTWPVLRDTSTKSEHNNNGVEWVSNRSWLKGRYIMQHCWKHFIHAQNLNFCCVFLTPFSAALCSWMALYWLKCSRVLRSLNCRSDLVYFAINVLFLLSVIVWCMIILFEVMFTQNKNFFIIQQHA